MDDGPERQTGQNLYLQMSKAFLASPDTADTFLAQNWTADESNIPSAEAFRHKAEL